MSMIYQAKHRRTQGLETLLRTVSSPLNRKQSVAVGAFTGLFIGFMVWLCLVH